MAKLKGWKLLKRRTLLGGLGVVLYTVSGCMGFGATTAGLAEVVVLDDATSPGTAFSDVSKIRNAAFRAFVDAALKTLDRNGIGHAFATERSAATRGSALRIVRIPVAGSGEAVIAAPDVTSEKTPFAVETPWADLAFDAATGRLSGTIYWNERQILRDQALRAGMTDTLRIPRGSLPRSVFNKAANAHAERMLQRQPHSGPAPGTPPELQWLFENVPQSTFAPFFITSFSEVQGFARAAVDCYAALVSDLVSLCLQGRTPVVRVDALRDLGPFSEWVTCEFGK